MGIWLSGEEGVTTEPENLEEQSKLMFLCTAELAETIGDLLRVAGEVIGEQRDHMLAEYDSVWLYDFLRWLEDYGGGMTRMALSLQLKVPSRSRRPRG